MKVERFCQELRLLRSPGPCCPSGRRVHPHRLPAGLLYLSQLVAQATGVGRPDHRQRGRAAVGPIGGRRLGVEHGRLASGCTQCDGQMQGQGGLTQSLPSG